MPRAGDTFVRASSITLASHTPTGPDAGSGWTLQLGSAQVVGGANYVEETNITAGNRYGMNTSMLGEDMDVTLDATFTGSPVFGNFLFAGPIARKPTAAGQGLEFQYDWSQGTAGAFDIGGTQYLAAWPGNPTTMRMVCRGATCYGYVNGVLRITHTDTTYRNNLYAGILLGNFQNQSSKRVRGANFMASSAPAPLPHKTQASRIAALLSF